jgi:hypothetical protein
MCKSCGFVVGEGRLTMRINHYFSIVYFLFFLKLGTNYRLSGNYPPYFHSFSSAKVSQTKELFDTFQQFLSFITIKTCLINYFLVIKHSQ